MGLEPAAQGEQTGTLSEGGVLIGNSLGSSGVAGKLGYERAELITRTPTRMCCIRGPSFLRFGAVFGRATIG
ncbi:hypothetical protein HMSSN036_85880 [Paenibacillus macerans]|nr:hypothetical protein HMSSN036_85880 [Paenibacillus macerans]